MGRPSLSEGARRVICHPVDAVTGVLLRGKRREAFGSCPTSELCNDWRILRSHEISKWVQISSVVDYFTIFDARYNQMSREVHVRG